MTIWNVAWKRPTSKAGIELLNVIEIERPHVFCACEALTGFQPQGGHVVTSEPDYGYPLKEGYRKVLLWSAAPWQQVDCVGSLFLPSGRFISAVTHTQIGLLRFVAMCVPWRAAHVSTGRRDKRPWEDHGRFLDGLVEVLERYSDDVPTVVLGDLNQTVPRTRAPVDMYLKLQRALAGRWEILTAGTQRDGINAIDHVAVTKQLTGPTLRTHSKFGVAGTELSDHFGVSIKLERRLDPSK